jgi:glucose-6-phosphate isomerase
MYLECTCSNITMDTWERLMKGAKRMNKRLLHRLIRRELPELYEALCLNLRNPYGYFQTKSHYILVHSAIEYFIARDA